MRITDRRDVEFAHETDENLTIDRPRVNLKCRLPSTPSVGIRGYLQRFPLYRYYGIPSTRHSVPIWRRYQAPRGEPHADCPIREPITRQSRVHNDDAPER